MESDYVSGEFRPDEPISRYWMAIMSCRALGLVGSAKSHNNELPQFSDARDLYDWTRGYIIEAVNAGSIKGFEDNSFRPYATTTRAEATALSTRINYYSKNSVIPIELDFRSILVPATPETSHIESSSDVPTTIESNLGHNFIDNRVYVSLKDVYELQAAIDQNPNPSLTWDRVTQKLSFTYDDNQIQAQAGMLATINGQAISSLPTRMHNWNIMIPIYDLETKENLCIWDCSSK